MASRDRAAQLGVDLVAKAGYPRQGQYPDPAQIDSLHLDSPIPITNGSDTNGLRPG